jgi:RNA polymerase-associated protein RTF1
MIQKRNKDKVDSVNVVLKRGQLRTARETAVNNGDEAEIKRIDQELQELEDRHGKKLSGASQMERLAKLNAENRKRNIAELRKAELEEKRAARNATVANPFARVKTVAKTRHVTDDKKKEDEPNSADGNGSPKVDGETKSQASPVGVGLLGSTTKGRRRGGIDEVIANYDFGIEIDI